MTSLRDADLIEALTNQRDELEQTVRVLEMDAPPRPGTGRWRTGRKVGRTIYSMIGRLPHDDDVLIGVMDTAELAQEAVDSYNATHPGGRCPS